VLFVADIERGLMWLSNVLFVVNFEIWFDADVVNVVCCGRRSIVRGRKQQRQKWWISKLCGKQIEFLARDDAEYIVDEDLRFSESRKSGMR